MSHSPVYVSHSYHLGVALVGNATPERGFSDKNVSFLWCFSKISNFRFFIIRSCFYSRVVSLFGPSELPLAQANDSSSTPSSTIDITQHALKGQKLCKLSGFLKLLPLQGALLTDIIPRAMPWAKSFCPFRACCLYELLGLYGVLIILASCLQGVLLILASCLYGELLILASCLQGVLLILASCLYGELLI